ncbi:hypothetical protein OsJ_14934 [Oryza sativa Japonica Group]|uniref:Methyltransferase type 11 domain-containing protein n=1 Tax=Oryza sativa subsp. japonica TaxID=39947 RepID=A3AU73_ORYSJ|nr:hypothetical protein OsJ_14934 [Oryza sativa Japonica Group]
MHTSTKLRIPTSQQQQLDAAIMDGAHRSPAARPPAPPRSKMKLLLLVIATNLVSVYLFSGASLSLRLPAGAAAPSIHLWDSSALLRDLGAKRAALAAAPPEVRGAPRAVQRFVAPPRFRARRARRGPGGQPGGAGSGIQRLARGAHRQTQARHRTRTGSRSGSPPSSAPTSSTRPSVSLAAISRTNSRGTWRTTRRMPDDADALELQLILKGCEPLPRRRCRPRSPARYVEPAPLPGSLWSIPPDTTVNWSPYACKNYTCLVGRARARGGGGGSYECKDCFDLAAGGKERRRWMSDNGGPGFSIDGVLASRAPGTVRVGLDIGGGAGTFAARMRERGVTVVTTTLDVGAPFSAFVASRGLVPLQLSLAQRLPLADGVMDIVHAMQLGGWVPGAVLELALFDVYRVLRPGGVFWLDHFACVGPRLNDTYAPILDRVGFRRLRWKASRKLDLGAERNEWYLSALLEKPLT